MPSIWLERKHKKIPALNNFLKQVINFNFNGNAVGRALAEVGKKGASSASKGAVNSAANSALRGTIVVAAVRLWRLLLA